MSAKTFALRVALVLYATAPAAVTQSLRIGVVDFYGLRRISPNAAREVLGIAEGDSLDPSDSHTKPAFTAAERRLEALPGVVRARVNVNCCEAGRAVLYVGIEEEGAPTVRFRAAPDGHIRLPAAVVQAGQEFSQALMQAVLRGDAGEDDSEGHSLMHDPTARSIQQRFVGFAARDLTLLRDVLRQSAEETDRALAAQVLGYAANKGAVVDDLVFGMTDPSESVRNNAMRALAIIAGFAAKSPGLGIHVPFTPFIDLLNSPIWTDRNKASFALEELSKNRDPAMLATVHESALPSLVEMARWKSDGHAGAAFWVLGRIGGLTEDEIQSAWRRHDREAVIRAATER